MGRWLAATVIAAVAVAASWVASQWVFGLTVEASVGIATLVFALIAGPASVWAGRGGDAGQPGLWLGGDPPARPAAPGPVTEPAAVRIFNVGPRNLWFTGRDAVLESLHTTLTSGGHVVVQALYGMGGVGKTALVVEYAHRFAASYDVVWWVDAERANLIGEQMAGLAVAGGWVADSADSTAAIAEVRRRLVRMSRWLLVFDNAQSPGELLAWLALGPGHVLVTSRHPGWHQIAARVEINVFTREESTRFLRSAVSRLTEREADDIAVRTGDLPLALAQAAGVLAETGMSAQLYLEELARHADHVLSVRPPSSYPVPLAAAIRVSVRRLQDEDEAALQLLRLCAVMAPDPVPVDLLFPAPAGVLTEPLATVAGSKFEVTACVGRLGRLGLARVSPEGLELHRLTQAVLVDQLDAKEQEQIRGQVERLLVAGAPDNSDDPGLWPDWARLLPHVLKLAPAHSSSEEVRVLANDVVRFLLNRGEAEAGRALADEFVDVWVDSFGEEDMSTLTAANHLARAQRELGLHEEALGLSRDVFERYQRLTGDDDPATLAAATGLAQSLRALGRTQEALDLDQDTYARKRRVLGHDHPSTLTSANGLAADLRELGRLDEAIELDRETWTRKRNVLGDDHPSTLTSAANLATDLRLSGHVGEAMALEEETFARKRRALGDNHPQTLASARNLAADLRALGYTERANALTREAEERATL